MLLYPARRKQLRICIPVGLHLKFDQRHVTKNQPITVLVLLSEILGV